MNDWESAAEGTYNAAAAYDDSLNWRPPVNAGSRVTNSDVTLDPTDLTELVEKLHKWHPYRVNRIIRDLKWLDKKGRKYGIRIIPGRRR